MKIIVSLFTKYPPRIKLILYFMCPSTRTFWYVFLLSSINNWTTIKFMAIFVSTYCKFLIKCIIYVTELALCIAKTIPSLICEENHMKMTDLHILVLKPSAFRNQYWKWLKLLLPSPFRRLCKPSNTHKHTHTRFVMHTPWQVFEYILNMITIIFVASY